MATQAGIHSQVKIFYDGHKEPQNNHLEKFKDHINWLRITDSDFDYIDLTRTNKFLDESLDGLIQNEHAFWCVCEKNSWKNRPYTGPCFDEDQSSLENLINAARGAIGGPKGDLREWSVRLEPYLGRISFKDGHFGRISNIISGPSAGGTETRQVLYKMERLLLSTHLEGALKYHPGLFLAHQLRTSGKTVIYVEDEAN